MEVEGDGEDAEIIDDEDEDEDEDMDEDASEAEDNSDSDSDSDSDSITATFHPTGLPTPTFLILLRFLYASPKFLKLCLDDHEVVYGGGSEHVSNDESEDDLQDEDEDQRGCESKSGAGGGGGMTCHANNAGAGGCCGSGSCGTSPQPRPSKLVIFINQILEEYFFLSTHLSKRISHADGDGNAGGDGKKGGEGGVTALSDLAFPLWPATASHVKKAVDATVQAIVKNHLKAYGTELQEDEEKLREL
ncbi:hypothetical protein HK102_008931, partial [Quaeritorhiza haematococci]